MSITLIAPIGRSAVVEVDGSTVTRAGVFVATVGVVVGVLGVAVGVLEEPATRERMVSVIRAVASQPEIARTLRLLEVGDPWVGPGAARAARECPETT